MRPVESFRCIDDILFGADQIDGTWKSAAGLNGDCNVKKRSAGGWTEHLQQ